MFSKYFAKCIFWVVLLCNLLILGCTSQSVDDSVTPVQITPPIIIADEANLITQSPDYVIESQSTNTLPSTTPPPSSTAPILITSDPTSVPTLSPIEASQHTLTMFETNGGCLFPCWWGMVPGQTEWETIQSFLSDFAVRINLPESTRNLSALVAFFQVPDMQFPIRHIYSIQDNRFAGFEGFAPNIPQFEPASLLNTYGLPEEIWMRTGAGDGSGLPFRITFYYPQHNFLIIYRQNDATYNDKFIYGCVSELNYDAALSGYMVIWSQNESSSYFEAIANTLDGTDTQEDKYDRSLEEATGMTIESFYETFRQPDQPLCLETPRDLWDWGAIPPPPTPAR